jgi:hypothetical protein
MLELAESTSEPSKWICDPAKSTNAVSLSDCRTSPSKYWPFCWNKPGEVVTREELRHKLWPADAKTLARLGQVIGPEVIGELHERLMELARERGVVRGRKIRVDTPVVETNIHYPTDSALLVDGARVLTRTMKKVKKATDGLKKRIRDRMRSVNKKVLAIALTGRLRGRRVRNGASSGIGNC